MKVKSTQNIFDVTLQHYGTLDQLIKLSSDNGLRIDQEPPFLLDIAFDTGIGEKRVKQFANENDHIFTNEAIAETAAIIAGDGVNLSPETGVIFIYK